MNKNTNLLGVPAALQNPVGKPEDQNFLYTRAPVQNSTITFGYIDRGKQVEDIDFQTIMAMVKVLVQHSFRIFSHLLEDTPLQKRPHLLFFFFYTFDEAYLIIMKKKLHHLPYQYMDLDLALLKLHAFRKK